LSSKTSGFLANKNDTTKQKLAIVTTHPIQYYAPIFRLLTQRGKVEVKVFYTWSQAQEKKYDPDFKKEVVWDIDLLGGYHYTFVNNVSSRPGSSHFRGIDNPTLVAEIGEWEPTAMLVFGWAFKSHLAVLRNFKGNVPVYFRGDSTLLDEPASFSIKKMLRRLFLRWVYTHVDYALYVGNNNKQYFGKHGLQNRQLIKAPHAIDNLRFSSYSTGQIDHKNEWRQNRAIPLNAMVFLFVGKFSEKKDPLCLLNAFLQINQPSACLVFVGNGELEDALKQAAFGYENIFFEPFQNQTQMPGIYKACDVYVLPSKGPGETWGLAVNEAMACAKPVVVSNKCGCASDLVKQGENGFTFSAGNVDQLAAILQGFVTGKHNTEAMGKQSIEIIRNYSFAAICAAIENHLLH